MTGSDLITSFLSDLNLGPVKIATATGVAGTVEFGGNGIDAERQLAQSLDIFVPTAEAQTGEVNLDLLFIQGSIKVRGGTGNDVLDMDDINTTGALTVDLGAGNDQFRLEQTTSSPTSVYRGPMLLTGGAGADTFLLAGNMAGQAIFFSKQVVVDGGAGTDTVTVGSKASFNPDLPLQEKNIP